LLLLLLNWLTIFSYSSSNYRSWEQPSVSMESTYSHSTRFTSWNDGTMNHTPMRGRICSISVGTNLLLLLWSWTGSKRTVGSSRGWSLTDNSKSTHTLHSGGGCTHVLHEMMLLLLLLLLLSHKLSRRRFHCRK